MELILSGGSGKKQEKKPHELFLRLVKNQPILYIPIAMENRPYEDCYNWINQQLKNQKITMLTSFLQKINLNDFKGIYIGGGNTFKLLKELKESNFDKKLKNFKGVIYGGSAGAIIFGKNISTAAWGHIKDKNKVKLKNLSALNLLKNYNIQAHYRNKEKKETIEFVKKTKTPIIALPEDSAVYVKNKKIVPINKVYIFR